MWRRQRRPQSSLQLLQLLLASALCSCCVSAVVCSGDQANSKGDLIDPSDTQASKKYFFDKFVVCLFIHIFLPGRPEQTSNAPGRRRRRKWLWRPFAGGQR